jgi:hypothetical protein
LILRHLEVPSLCVAKNQINSIVMEAGENKRIGQEDAQPISSIVSCRSNGIPRQADTPVRQLMLYQRGEQILARFPGPVTVRPVPTRSDLVSVAFAILVVIACLWGIWHRWTREGSAHWGLGLCAALFAFFGTAIVSNLRTNSMTLDRDGFEVVIGFRKKKRRYRWRDVSAFESRGVETSRVAPAVAFDEAGKDGGALAFVDRALGFRNSSLLEDYGMGTKQLAELLNRWRDRALAKR